MWLFKLVADLFHGVLDTGLRMIISANKTKKQALCY